MGTSPRLQKLKENMRKVSKYLYWGISLIVISVICLVLYNRMQKPITSILFFMGGFLMVYFYWIKWFKIPDAHPGWPPSISPCPDFLTLIMVPGMAGGAPTPVCVDYVGVSSNNQFKKSSTAEAVSAIASDRVFVPSPPTATGVSDATRLQTICDNVRSQGLSWTGVCNDM